MQFHPQSSRFTLTAKIGKRASEMIYAITMPEEQGLILSDIYDVLGFMPSDCGEVVMNRRALLGSTDIPRTFQARLPCPAGQGFVAALRRTV